MVEQSLLIHQCTWQKIDDRFSSMEQSIDGLYKIISNGESGSNLPLYLSINEACELLNISRRTCYRWLSNGIIKGHQLPGAKSILLNRNELLQTIK